MMVKPAGATLLSLFMLLGAAPDFRVHAVEVACAHRNPTLSNYTFQMSVALKMKHFPWLHLHIAGNGRYLRGHKHIVVFTKMPFFARGFHQIDLSPLDPCMWPASYVVTMQGESGGMKSFLLRPRTVNPTDSNPLAEALVTLDDRDATREVVLHYARGSIQLALTPAAVGAYLLPATADVNIDMPGQALTAHATLSNYTILRETSP